MLIKNRWLRLWRHWQYPRRRVAKLFPVHELAKLSRAVEASEARHCGQVCFVIESGWPAGLIWRKSSPQRRALQWFGEIRAWDTELNSGVLVYVSVADRQVEIIADRGIARAVQPDVWQEICAQITGAFAQKHYLCGLEKGLEEITRLLENHFPRNGADIANELPDEIILH